MEPLARIEGSFDAKTVQHMTQYAGDLHFSDTRRDFLRMIEKVERHPRVVFRARSSAVLQPLCRQTTLKTID